MSFVEFLEFETSNAINVPDRWTRVIASIDMSAIYALIYEASSFPEFLVLGKIEEKRGNLLK